MQLNLARFSFNIIGMYFYSKTLYQCSPILQEIVICPFVQEISCILVVTFTWLLGDIQATLVKSSWLCKTSNKFALKRNFLLLNDEIILTYWPLNNACFTFSLMSCGKHVNDKFHRNELAVLKFRLLFSTQISVG